MNAKFRLVRFNETQFWRDGILPEGAVAWGVYLFKEGEATYACSLTPSTWCEFMYNEFDNVPDGWDEDGQLQFCATEDMYVGYIDVKDTKLDITVAREFEEETERELWDAARESFHSNWSSF